MKTNFIKVTILFASLMFTTAVFARDGIFFNLSAGGSYLSGMPTAAEAGAKSLSEQNYPAWQASLGYIHDLYPSFGIGVEAGYGSYSRYRYNFKAGRLNTTSYVLRFMFDMAAHIKKTDIFLKIGGVRNSLSYTGLQNDEETKIQPITELAVAYYLSPHYAIQLTGEHVFGEKITRLIPAPYSAPSITAVLLGLHIKFF